MICDNCRSLLKSWFGYSPLFRMTKTRNNNLGEVRAPEPLLVDNILVNGLSVIKS